MNHGSLFSGIGGFDLAAEWMGWENIFHCEIEPFPRKVLNYYWPNAISYEDIKETDFTPHRGTIDVLSGGFPCQPFSVAGKRKGTEDDRNLWPEMLRAIREIAPTFIVGENVYGLINWSGGLVFDQVQTDLENEGYEVIPVILPACGKNAPHKRERIWFIAYNSEYNRNSKGPGSLSGKSKGEGLGQQHEVHKSEQPDNVRGLSTNSRSQQFQERTQERDKQNKKEERAGMDDRAERSGNIRNASNSNSQRGCSRNNKRQDAEYVDTRSETFRFRGDFERWPTVAPLLFRDDGLSTQLDGITLPKFRNESIKAAGNAIVPQVAYEIFKTIEQFNT